MSHCSLILFWHNIFRPISFDTLRYNCENYYLDSIYFERSFIMKEHSDIIKNLCDSIFDVYNIDLAYIHNCYIRNYQSRIFSTLLNQD